MILYCTSCNKELDVSVANTPCELCEMRDKEVPHLVRQNRELSRRNEELGADNIRLDGIAAKLEKRIADFTGGQGRATTFLDAQAIAEASQLKNRLSRDKKSKWAWLKLFSK